MMLIDFLLKHGWVSGAFECKWLPSEPNHVYFKCDNFSGVYNFARCERLTTPVSLTDGANIPVKYNEYLEACSSAGLSPKLIAGEVLSEEIKRNPFHQHLPPISRIFYGVSISLLPSALVIVRVRTNDGGSINQIGYYSHAEQNWYVSDIHPNKNVIEWWPMPEAGTGTKPPQK